MSAPIPSDRELDSVLEALSREDRDWVWVAVEQGTPVRNPEHAAIAVAFARRRKRHALTRDLPVYAGTPLVAGLVGFLVTGRSEVLGFSLIVGSALFVGWLWWGETWRPRHRAMVVNLRLLEHGDAGTPATERKAENHWLMAVPLAWATSAAVGWALHLGLGAPTWIGVPLFLAALFLFRRLIVRTVQSIDEWGNR